MTGVLQVVKPGKFPAGRNELPFEFPLKAKGSRKLFETYHGVFVNIQVIIPKIGILITYMAVLIVLVHT